MADIRSPAPRTGGNRADLIAADTQSNTAEHRLDQGPDNWRRIDELIVDVIVCTVAAYRGLRP
jgi:hypothetical protein